MTASIVSASRRQFFILPLLAAAGAPADAGPGPCAAWKVNRQPVSLRQSDKAVVQLVLNQSGSRVFGKADYFRSYVGKTLGIISKGVDVNMVGNVDGVLEGTRFDFKIAWNNMSLGMYKLKIDRFGRITGISYDFHNPSNRVSIVADSPVACDRPA